MNLHLELHTFTNWLHLHPEWGGVAAFLVAFAESLAFVGTIIPGSITMTAIGVLVGSGIISITMTLSLAIAGAVVGDTLSYFFGYYFKDKMHNIWPFKKYPQWLDHAKAFFEHHGGKSVFLGRFIGPVRAMIPILAGMLHMKPLRFLPIDILAAACWAPLYLLPGFLIGIATLALPGDIATKLLIALFTILIIIWLFFWLLKKMFSLILSFFDHQLNKLWHALDQSKHLRFICNLLRDANHPTDHGQLVLGFLFLFSMLFFILIFIGIVYYHPLLQLNDIVYYFFRDLRILSFDKVMIFITTFGEQTVVLPLAITIFAWLAYTKRWRAAWHWLAVCFLSAGLANLFKAIYFSARPTGIFLVSPSSSFPSGHVALSSAFYGFLAWLICLEKPQWKKIIYSLTALLILLVLLSRLYLGEHWLTDTLGGLSLSTAIATLCAISYQRKLSKPPHPVGLIIVTLLTLALTSSYFLMKHYNQQLQNTNPIWLQQNVPLTSWWSGSNQPTVTYRFTHFGHPVELLNIQWAGSLNSIRHKLRAHGWVTLSDRHFRHFINNQFAETFPLEHIHLRLFPKLLNDQRPVLMMVKLPTNNSALPIIITLWRANIMLTPDHIPLWVGSINYLPSEDRLLFHALSFTVPKDQALSLLQPILFNEHWQVVELTKTQVPLSLLSVPNPP